MPSGRERHRSVATARSRDQGFLRRNKEGEEEPRRRLQEGHDTQERRRRRPGRARKSFHPEKSSSPPRRSFHPDKSSSPPRRSTPSHPPSYHHHRSPHPGHHVAHTTMATSQ